MAQLDRASDYESEGREFESLQAHQYVSPVAYRDSKASERRAVLAGRANPSQTAGDLDYCMGSGEDFGPAPSSARKRPQGCGRK